MSRTRKGRPSQKAWFDGKHAFEHWYRDNQVYFVTARCKGRFAALANEQAKYIFWEQFNRYSKEFDFVPWVTSLMDNHYHSLGYLRIGEKLGPMMQRIHGSVSKLVNDTLDIRLVPFWTDTRKQSYFDGCIRDELQCRRAYRYTLTQSVRHGICLDWLIIPYTCEC